MNKLPTASDSDASEAHKAEGSSSLYLIASMADTTWRMFVPTLGLLLIGNALDGNYGTKPWLMLIGAGLGGLIAAYLVRLQLRKGAK
jgi:F0F1-type ATP synthase assembly protein I